MECRGRDVNINLMIVNEGNVKQAIKDVEMRLHYRLAMVDN